MAVGDLVGAVAAILPTVPLFVEILGGFIVGTYVKHVVWVHHLAIENLDNHDRGIKPSPVLMAFTKPVRWFGKILDAVYNIGPASLAFWDWPRELSFQKRCKRYLSAHSEQTKRYKVANWFDRHFFMPLNPNRRTI